MRTTDIELRSIEIVDDTEIVDPYLLDYDAEAEMDRWLEAQAREAGRLREDAEEAIWDAEQMSGDPVTNEVRAGAIENLITAHYDARNAGRDGDDVFALYNALQALYASLPNAGVFGPVSGARRVPHQRPRSSRRRRSTRTRKNRSPGRSGDADPDLPRSPKAHRAIRRISASHSQFRVRVWLELLANLAAELRSLNPLVGALALERPA